MSARIEDEKFRGVYAFEDNAAETFRAAGRRGLLRVYDVPHGHWRAAHSILEEEAELSPEWARSTNRTHDVAREHARKDAELEQADLIFAASSFTMRTLEQVPELSGSVGMIPHGGPLISDELFEWSPLARNSDRLRVLYVGDLNQRMGLSYLFRACHDLRGAVDLTVIGTRPPDGCAALDRELREVTWRPNSSQEQIQAEMAAHDVFVLPALFDGSGQTLVEAMAMGLPVIATENSAAPDVIDDGVEGFIIPVRSSDSIVENLDLLRREPDRRVEMSANAARRARLHTWENYERLLAASVATALACH